MKSIFILLYLVNAPILFSQIVTIPDVNFKSALVNSNVIDTTGNGLGDSVADTNGDGEIQITEAEAIINLIISYYNVVSLEGIQSFTNLEVLKSRGNFIETIDLSQNPELIWLHLSTNPLTSIDVSNNPNLEKLWIYNNQLTSIDVSQNPNLTSFRCYTNNLTELNIANGDNVLLSNFLAYENPNLSCIQVDDENFANNQLEWQIDPISSFSEECILGINESAIQNLLLYPLPTENELFIEYSGNTLEKITIYNLEGKLMYTVSNTNKIDVSNLKPGIYILHILSEGNIINEKFIKK